MSKEILTEFRHAKKVYKRQMQRQVTEEEYRDTVQLCRDGVRKARADLEINLVRNVKDNKKGFYKYIKSKREMRGKYGPAPEWVREMGDK